MDSAVRRPCMHLGCICVSLDHSLSGDVCICEHSASDHPLPLPPRDAPPNHPRCGRGFIAAFLPATIHSICECGIGYLAHAPRNSTSSTVPSTVATSSIPQWNSPLNTNSSTNTTRVQHAAGSSAAPASVWGIQNVQRGSRHTTRGGSTAFSGRTVVQAKDKGGPREAVLWIMPWPARAMIQTEHLEGDQLALENVREDMRLISNRKEALSDALKSHHLVIPITFNGGPDDSLWSHIHQVLFQHFLAHDIRFLQAGPANPATYEHCPWQIAGYNNNKPPGVRVLKPSDLSGHQITRTALKSARYSFPNPVPGPPIVIILVPKSPLIGRVDDTVNVHRCFVDRVMDGLQTVDCNEEKQGWGCWANDCIVISESNSQGSNITLPFLSAPAPSPSASLSSTAIPFSNSSLPAPSAVSAAFTSVSRSLAASMFSDPSSSGSSSSASRSSPVTFAATSSPAVASSFSTVASGPSDPDRSRMQSSQPSSSPSISSISSSASRSLPVASSSFSTVSVPSDPDRSSMRSVVLSTTASQWRTSLTLVVPSNIRHTTTISMTGEDTAVSDAAEALIRQIYAHHSGSTPNNVPGIRVNTFMFENLLVGRRSFRIGEGVGHGPERDILTKAIEKIVGRDDGLWRHTRSGCHVPVFRSSSQPLPAERASWYKTAGTIYAAHSAWLGTTPSKISPFLAALTMMPLGDLLDLRFIQKIDPGIAEDLEPWPLDRNLTREELSADRMRNLIDNYLPSNVDNLELLNADANDRIGYVLQIHAMILVGASEYINLHNHPVIQAFKQGLDHKLTHRSSFIQSFGVTVDDQKRVLAMLNYKTAISPSSILDVINVRQDASDSAAIVGLQEALEGEELSLATCFQMHLARWLRSTGAPINIYTTDTARTSLATCPNYRAQRLLYMATASDMMPPEGTHITFHLVGSLEGLVWTPSQNPTDQDPISILKFSTCGRQVFVLCTAILESILRSEFPLDDHAFTRFDMLMFSSLMPIPNTPEFYNRL
ncbi:hypothetical protein C8J56DRAFT_534840 [Mycena floridula]|nr:hypothetical protein C8J56DRAFT_534840 [Mycena floridula]